MRELQPFPVDDATLDLLMQAIDPWSNGDPEAQRSCLWDFLKLMSEMGGSGPQYTDHSVITALVQEVRRLRAEAAAAPLH